MTGVNVANSTHNRIAKASAVIVSLLVICSCADRDPQWRLEYPGRVGMDLERLEEARSSALRGGGSGIVMRAGKVVMSWGSQTRRYDLMSSTKSIGVSALGLALADGHVGLDDAMAKRLDELGDTYEDNAPKDWIDAITLRHIASQTSGFDKPGGLCELSDEPGTVWRYSDCGPNWMADYLTVAYGNDLAELLHERVFLPIGISRDDLKWRENTSREATLRGLARREFSSGISANVRAMALIGELYRRNGEWGGEQILPKDFIRLVKGHDPTHVTLPVADEQERSYGDGSAHYAFLWWNNSDGRISGVPSDTIWSWGLSESFIVVIPSLDIVVVRAGEERAEANSVNYHTGIEEFIRPVVDAVNHGAPYPNSQAISGIDWGDEVSRAAEGSDNWPVTWADDGDLYTAYGDGWGFVPRLAEKLSLGFAKLGGQPPSVVSTNIRSPSGERIGDGATGKKASGLLMIDDVLYMWVRNADEAGKHCQLAWSADRGVTWEWSNWIHQGLGYCVFLNFGKNYEGARDDYVYTYSPDSVSAYVPGDQVVLARVHRTRLRDLSAYEYFAGHGESANPLWTTDFADRRPVFVHQGSCNRLDVVFNPGLDKYMLSMRNLGETGWRPGGDEHWGLYEADSPWGPWTTVFYTKKWDIDPGEAVRIPTKWISADGSQLSIVFSGDDSFSTRTGTLSIQQP
jgi:CubicO group peptidase (beta-lactamase class C family)